MCGIKLDDYGSYLWNTFDALGMLSWEAPRRVYGRQDSKVPVGF